MLGARARLALLRVDRRRLIALLVAALIAFVTYSTIRETQQRRDALGDTRLVAVARVDVVAGSMLSQEHIELAERPVQFVPPAAIGPEAVGAILIADVSAGEVVVAQRIGSAGSPLATNERAVTVPLPLTPPRLDIGDTVEIVGLQAADVPGQASPTVSAVVITTGRVLAVNDEAVSIATPDHAALEVLRFLAAGSVELVVTPQR